MKRVLSVGQCGFDHAAIASLLERTFDVEVSPADTPDEVLRAIEHGGAPDLILVNRKFDLDGGDGLELIRRLKGAPAVASVPVMLVSNYPEYQQQAMDLGALEGFGKSQLAAPATLAKLQPLLG
jgi:CheY-like chemotaxis protein